MNQKTAQDQFYRALLELQYSDSKNLLKKAQQLAQKANFKDWPKNKTSFWNSLAFWWHMRVNKKTKQTIKKELKKYKKPIIELGSGSFCYRKSSTAFDISKEMLKLNTNKNKLQGDLEKPLKIENNSYQTATLIFVINYIKNIDQLFQEIHRILKPKGKLLITQSQQNTSALEYQQTIKEYSIKELKEKLKQFKVKTKEINHLHFLICEKRNKI